MKLFFSFTLSVPVADGVYWIVEVGVGECFFFISLSNFEMGCLRIMLPCPCHSDFHICACFPRWTRRLGPVCWREILCLHRVIPVMDCCERLRYFLSHSRSSYVVQCDVLWLGLTSAVCTCIPPCVCMKKNVYIYVSIYVCV